MFRQVASEFLRKVAAAVTEQERSCAKRVAYGIIYGIGAEV